MTDRDSPFWGKRKVQRLIEEERFDEAVDMLRRKGEQRVGARLFLECGYPEKAADLLAEIGDYQEAGRMALAARNLDRAAQYFEESGDLLAAARTFEKARNFTRALALYLRLGDVERVTTLALHEVEDPKVLRSSVELLRERKQYEPAAHILVKMRRELDAARMMEAAGDLKGAVRVFEAANRLDMAAPLLVRLGDLKRAAHHYMKSGQFDDAVKTLIKSGQPLLAGRLLRRLSRLPEAVAVLGAILPSSPDFREAALLGSAILEQMNKFTESAARLKDLLEVIGYTPENEEIIYRLVDLQLESGDLAGAEESLDRAKHEGMDPEMIDGQIEAVRVSTMQLKEDAPEPSPEVVAAARSSSSLGFPRSDRYKLVNRIGRGGHGVLYLVEDRNLGRQVVFKQLHSESLPSEVARKYFEREARAAARLDHPNIVRVFDVGEMAGRPFYTMEFVRGVNLLELTESKRHHLSLDEKLHVSIQICDALQHAHENHVLHRDIKLDNIMVTQELDVKLLDFGLAKAIDENPATSLFIVGTPAYMSPEQMAGKALDGRTDLFSLGVLMYRLFTGKKPFRPTPSDPGGSREGPAPDPCADKPELPRPLCDAIRRCLERDPENRFDSAADLATALRGIPL